VPFSTQKSKKISGRGHSPLLTALSSDQWGGKHLPTPHPFGTSIAIRGGGAGGLGWLSPHF